MEEAEIQKKRTRKRELGQNTGVNVRPDIGAPILIIASGNVPTSE